MMKISYGVWLMAVLVIFFLRLDWLFLAVSITAGFWLIQERKKIEAIRLAIRGLIQDGRKIGGGGRLGAATRLRIQSSPGIEQDLSRLQYWMEAFCWQYASEETRKIEYQSTLLKGVDQLPGGVPGEQAFLRDLLASNALRFRANIMVVLFERASATGTVDLTMASQDRIPQGLERRLQKHAQAFLARRDAPSFVIRGGNSDVDQSGSFEPFGFAYAVSAIARRSSADYHGTVLLWLGYRDNQTPLPVEVSRAERMASMLSEKLEAFRQLRTFASQAREAREANRERGKLLVHFSHDLRSPLSNVRAVLSLCQAGDSVPEARGYIETALHSCDQISSLLDDLITFSRHRMGHLDCEPRLVNLVELVNTVAWSYKACARLKGIKLSWQSSASACLVMADPRHITRVLSNLLDNALKYTVCGEVQVCLIKDPTQQCRIQIRDTGVGLNPQQLAQLFTPFQRFHQKLSDGMGIGLALSKALAEANNGSLAVSSAPEKGSCFELRLPLTLPALGSAERSSQRNVFLGSHILVVDNDPACVSTLARDLRREKYTVSEAFNVGEAIRILSSTSIQCVITDNHMPSGGAASVLEHVRRMSSGLVVIVLTGDDENAPTLLNLGASAVLLKPVPIEKILECLCASRRDSANLAPNPSVPELESDRPSAAAAPGAPVFRRARVRSAGGNGECLAGASSVHQ